MKPRDRLTVGAGVALLAVLVAVLVLAAPAPAATATGDGDGGVEAKRIGEFDSPVYVGRAPGQRHRKLLFVVERDGVVAVLRGNRKLRRPFLDISDRVSTGGERGLLSIAFDPRYPRNRRFYAYYTDAEGDIRVSQFRRARRSKTRAKRREREVIEVPHPGAAHNGGTVAFGPDGHMYLATGDGGGGCDPSGHAQDGGSLLGKLLRIDPRRKRGYRVPADNPFVGSAPRDEIYALGLRNPFRFAFDRPSRTIAIGDVGQSSIEEVDYETLRGARGANFGWSTFEGTEPSGCGSAGPSPTPDRHSEPIHQYRHSGPGHTGCSITGGVVVRDRRLTSLFGRYVFADFCRGQLRSLVPKPGGAVDEGPVGVDLPNPSSFGSGRKGRLYATSLDGGLYRLRPARASGADAGRQRAGARRGGLGAKRIGDGRGGFAARRIGNFKRPVYVHGPSGADGLIFVVEQRGVIRMIKDGERLGGRFLDIRGRVRAGGEQGLLSVAFSPSYRKNRRFYVFYTDRRGDLTVDEFKRHPTRPRAAKRSSRRKVIEIRHRMASNHNGGQLQFGPDRKLYISTGDGGGAGDPRRNAQDRSSLLGKILRIDPRRKRGRRYTVPADNPFRGRPGRKEIFSLGLRNPFRFSFDQRRIAIGDVGQDAREEVDFERLGTAKGANFGWNAFEGTKRYRGPSASPPPNHHQRPIHEYSHSDGNCSITGGYVVRDRRIRSLLGRYLYADFCKGQVRSLIPRAKGRKRDRPAGLPNQPGISSFGEDARGRIYFTNLSTGGVFRIEPR